MKSVDDEPMNRKTLKTSETPEVEEAPISPISGDILKQKAQFFYHEITKKTDFRASHGWNAMAALEICNEVELAPASIEEFRTWIVEDNLATDVTGAEIIQEVTTEDDEVIEEAVLKKNFTISCDETLSATRTLLRWCEEKELDFSNILMLQGCDETLSATRTLLRWCEEKELDFSNILMLQGIQEQVNMSYEWEQERLQRLYNEVNSDLEIEYDGEEEEA
ncbi:hypothetical protein QE152_g33701 [Popillia japonica]|uniref:HTH CENPB-type domain-containing protein n=1 Tax=Popillia japonica TaxID=7064 RepID=A0AAW1IWB4_POPJA